MQPLVVSENKARKLIRGRRQREKFVPFESEDLGKCLISTRAIEAVQKHCGFDPEKCKLSLAQQGQIAWESQLQYQTLGQQERFIPFAIFVAWDGDIVVIDTEEFFPFG